MDLQSLQKKDSIPYKRRISQITPVNKGKRCSFFDK